MKDLLHLREDIRVAGKEIQYVDLLTEKRAAYTRRSGEARQVGKLEEAAKTLTAAILPGEEGDLITRMGRARSLIKTGAAKRAHCQ